jgi:hypothetical protein
MSWITASMMHAPLASSYFYVKNILVLLRGLEGVYLGRFLIAWKPPLLGISTSLF